MINNTYAELEIIVTPSETFDTMIVDPGTTDAICFCDGEHVARELLLAAGYQQRRGIWYPIRKFSVRQIREAYQYAAAKLDRFYQLTAPVKLAMCENLDCSPADLEAWFQRCSDSQFERACF